MNGEALLRTPTEDRAAHHAARARGVVVVDVRTNEERTLRDVDTIVLAIGRDLEAPAPERTPTPPLTSRHGLPNDRRAASARPISTSTGALPPAELHRLNYCEVPP